MKRTDLLVVTSTALAALLGVAGCGDNSHDCGPGTALDDNGYCVPDQTGSICGDGTVLDVPTNTCVPSDTVCGSGTVLVDGRCQDPSAGLMIDLEEGPEPNGLEIGATPAGVIEPKPVGEGFVVHGCIRPVNGAFDVDDYRLTVTAPTLLEITADGVEGLAAGFLTFGDPGDPDPQIQSFTRIGMNLATDTSQRQLYLPKAGTYDLLLTDSRTILPLLDGAPPPAAGNPDGDTTCYYVTVAQQTPAPVALDLAAGDTGAIGKDIKFYTATFGDGFTELTASIDSAFASPSLVLMNNGTLRQISDGQPDSDLLFAGILPTDSPLVVLDYVYNYDVVPPTYHVTRVGSGGATALSRTGGTVSEPEIAATASSVFDLNAFYYDVTAADEIDGFALTWNHPVDGLVLDQDGFILANFTYDGGFVGNTWSAYTGLLRHPAPGRYYFMVHDPAGTPGTTSLAATSTITAVTPAAVVEGTPLTGQAIDPTFLSNAFTYDAGTTDAWQQFDATGTGTGTLTLAFFDPTTAYGRLDALPAGTIAGPADAAPLFGHAFPATGGAFGRILLDDPTPRYVVTVNTQTTTGTPTFALDFARRAHDDLGTIAAGQAVSRLDQPLTTAAPVQRYLFRAAAGDRITTTVHPDNVLLDTQLQFLSASEAVTATSNPGLAGANDTLVFQQAGNGWTAFTVTSAGPLPVAGTNTFDLTVGAQPAVTYTPTAGATAYADACTGGTVVPLTATSSFPADDEGLSAAIAAPAGFEFFGFPVTSLRVSSNGFLGFGTLTSASPTNADMPVAASPNSVVAPYWDDLDLVAVCRKTVGGKLVLQWEGEVFATQQPVAFQAILDPATDSIELVYAAVHVPTGGSATIGVEDATGTHARKLGFNTAGVITPGASQLLTPN